jgi:hypothetical protein
MLLLPDNTERTTTVKGTCKCCGATFLEELGVLIPNTFRLHHLVLIILVSHLQTLVITDLHDDTDKESKITPEKGREFQI